MSSLDFVNKSYGMAFWFNKPSGSADFEQTLVDWCDQNEKGIVTGLKYYGSDLKLYSTVYDGSIWNEVTSSVHINDDTWYHVITCFDTATDDMCITVNGNLEDEIIANGHCSASSYADLYIGQNSEGVMSSCSISAVRADYRCWDNNEKMELYNFGIE